MCSLRLFLVFCLAPKVLLIGASPTSKKFKSRSQWDLSEMQERIQNLETFSLQLSPVLENKLDENNRKLEAINVRISKIESAIVLNLDKLSENLSDRNIQSELLDGSHNRKISAVNQKLDHLDRKVEENFSKLQVFVQNLNNKLEVTEKAFNRIADDLLSEISDAIYAIDDIKGTQSNIEENIRNLIENYNESQILEMLNKTACEDNKKQLIEMKKDIKSDLNDYANKVADMTFDMWENQKAIIKIIKSIEGSMSNRIINTDNEESIFSLNDPDDRFAEISDNFQKVLSNQQIFLDNCHRLQMDERQIEDEISEILKKLIHLIDQRSESENKELRNLEKALKNHDNHIYRNLNQANTNILNLFEKISKNDEVILNQIKSVNQIKSQLELNDDLQTNTEIFIKINQTEGNLIKKIDNQTQLIENSLQNIQNATKQVQNDLNGNFKEIFLLINDKNERKDNTSVDKLIFDIFGPPPNQTNDFIENSTKLVDYSNLIDVRNGQETEEVNSTSITENPTTNQNLSVL